MMSEFSIGVTSCRRFLKGSAMAGSAVALLHFLPVAALGADGTVAPGGQTAAVAVSGAGVSLFNGKDVSGWDGAP
ncbi:MAG: hypothetical protein NTV46_08775, partial [Verrucomicrobia bacterium]|nr:hypothetical protein [Verrucomicrobiota bacterium]